MPANKKYLSTPLQRLLKLTAGVVGGYGVMFSLHLVLAECFTPRDVVATAFLSGYLLWAILVLLAFLSRNGWRVWGLYLILTAVFYGLFYLLHT